MLHGVFIFFCRGWFVLQSICIAVYGYHTFVAGAGGGSTSSSMPYFPLDSGWNQDTLIQQSHPVLSLSENQKVLKMPFSYLASAINHIIISISLRSYI